MDGNNFKPAAGRFSENKPSAKKGFFDYRAYPNLVFAICEPADPVPGPIFFPCVTGV